MRWLFMIWFFMVMLCSPLFSNAQENLFNFHNLKLGMTYNQILKALKDKKVYLKTEEPKYYSMSIPIYDLLDIYESNKKNIDKQKMRIYYDNEVFFDLRNLNIEKPAYKFFYRDPYYLMEFKEIVSYQVAYASRINALLYQLWIKFYKDKVYALEYEATLNSLELNRVKNNYFKRYGRILTPGIQVVDRNNVVSIINLEQNTLSVTRIDKRIRSNIFDYLDNVSADILEQSHGYIINMTKDTKNAKKLILADKKNKLQKSLRNHYHFIDEL